MRNVAMARVDACGVLHSLCVPANLVLLLLFASTAPCAWAVAPLNDTGINFSTSSVGQTRTTCVLTDGAGQDCNHGRDAAAEAGTLQKVGGSAPNKSLPNGFDYTKISNSGNTLPESAALGSGPDDWACTRDNVTGLTWEIKTADKGLRDLGWTYSWYDSNSPDGDVGHKNMGSCYASQGCDTEAFAAKVAALALCGATDWRMPSIAELTSLVDYGRSDPAPAIDPTYFPNTKVAAGVGDYWSASTQAADPGSAWWLNVVSSTGYYGSGSALPGAKTGGLHVRLVRGGQ